MTAEDLIAIVGAKKKILQGIGSESEYLHSLKDQDGPVWQNHNRQLVALCAKRDGFDLALELLLPDKLAKEIHALVDGVL